MILLLLSVLAVVYVSAVWLFARNFLLAWICILAINFLNYAFGADTIFIAGLHIAPLDLMYLGLISAWVVRSRLYALKIAPLSIITIGYLLLFALSAGRGIVLFGLTEVGNEARGLMSEVLAFTYFVTIPHDKKTVKKVVVAYIVYSAALIAVCAAHYAGLPVGGTLGVAKDLVLSGNVLDRGIPASGAASMELAVLFAASWVIYRKHSRWLTALVAVSLPLLVILQHRSVWAMLAITVLAAMFIDRPVSKFVLKIGAAAVAVGLVLSLPSIGARQQILGELHESATNSDTLQWRFEAWQRSITQDQSPLTTLIGLPVGSGYLRLDSSAGGYTNFQPHNEFINQYLRVGLIGTALMILFLLRPLYFYFRYPKSGALLYPTPASWILVSIGTIVFCFPYSAAFDGIALIAMANGLIDAPPISSPIAANQRP
jgi:hypothetical protein